MRKTIIFLKALDLEDNRKLEIMSRFFNNNDTKELEYYFNLIENNISINKKDKLNLRYKYLYDKNDFDIESIQLYIDETFDLIKDSTFVQGQLLNFAWNDFLLVLNNKFDKYKNKAISLFSKLRGKNIND